MADLNLPEIVKRFVDATRDSDMCMPDKAVALGCIVLGLRPRVVVEIGVWMGSSFLPMALAMKTYGLPTTHRCIAIDPWSAAESVRDQRNPKNAAWWAGVSHEAAYNTFVKRVMESGAADLIEIERCSSNDARPPDRIDMLHIDGNHGEQVIRDVDRFCPKVRAGGIVIMDDIGWEKNERTTTAVELAITALPDLGFEQLYELGTGAVFQRVFVP